jgi:hypothetical protein
MMNIANRKLPLKTHPVKKVFGGGIIIMDSIGKIEKLEQQLNAIEKRLSILEGNHGLNCEAGNKILEMGLVLPEADIGGLHFNETKVHAVFEKNEDGNYYSRDILFVSARDADEGAGRDILSEYLASQEVEDAFIDALTDALIGFDGIRVFLPEENQGAKKYNGVTWPYWLRPPYSGYATNFTIVNSDGSPDYNGSLLAYGVAPAFCVR